MNKALEEYNQELIDFAEKGGLETFGLMSSHAWKTNPIRLLFTLSRYKFIAKMLSGKQKVLEVGCADAFATRIVHQYVESIDAIDIDPVFIADVQSRMTPEWKFNCFVHDILSSPLKNNYDAVYSLDVLEHIDPLLEQKFIQNIVDSIISTGVVIIGMPSIESQVYASPISKAGHVNCKSIEELKELMQKYFNNVLMFSMNDEVVHTGFSKMSHYIIAVCSHKKS